MDEEWFDDPAWGFDEAERREMREWLDRWKAMTPAEQRREQALMDAHTADDDGL